MNFSDKFKISWWGILFWTATFYLYGRHVAIFAGHQTTADVVAMAVWVVLAFLPLVSEIDFFGFSLKKEIERVERSIGVQLNNLRLELQNSIAVSATNNQNLTINVPRPDSELPFILEMVRNAIRAEMAQQDISQTQARSSGNVQISQDEQYVISVRQNIEREVRRIFFLRFPEGGERYTSLLAWVRVLASREVITTQFADAILEVYRTCSAAVHGQGLTNAQIAFVRDVAEDMISTLRTTN